MNPGDWDKHLPGKVRIASLNIARLGPHMEDIKIDPTLLKANIIHLCETWVHPNQEGAAQFQLEGFAAHFVSIGDGRGLATYSKEEFMHQEDRVGENYQITKFSSGTIDSIHIYRCIVLYWIIISKLVQLLKSVSHISHKSVKHEISANRSANGSQEELVDNLEQLVDMERLTTISGDMNICLDKHPNCLLSTALHGLGFQQLVTSPTHKAGGRIDHVYLRDPQTLVAGFHLMPYNPYYSDHDALCLSMMPKVLKFIMIQMSLEVLFSGLPLKLQLLTEPTVSKDLLINNLSEYDNPTTGLYLRRILNCEQISRASQ